MNLNEFYKKYNGKNVDVDNYAGAQCVDLIKAYFRDVLNVPVKAYGNAINYWTSFEKHKELTSNFEKVNGLPKKGDIVIFNYAPYGHIAIVWAINGNTLTVFEQNRTGKHDKCTLGKYTTNKVKGYLRHKTTNTKTPAKTIEITCTALYIRSAPSLTSKIAGIAKKGQRFKVAEIVYNGTMQWAKISNNRYISISNKNYFKFV